MNNEKIIDKIRKVLAMTKSTYKEEAEAALLKAQELMAQHGLTMSEVELPDKESQMQVVDTCIYEKRKTAWYEKQLGLVIANNFRCHVYNGIGRGIYFIGLADDVEVAREVFIYALNTMLYLAGEYVKREKERHWYNRGLKNDYLTGFIAGLNAKFKEQVESNGYALVLVKDALVVQAVEDKKLRKGRGSQHITGGSHGAWTAGYKDGKSFNEKKKMIRQS